MRHDTDINLWTELHRRRHALGPFYIAALLAGAGILGRGLALWELGTLAGAFALAGVARIHRRARRTWRRVYAGAVLAAMIAWVAGVRLFVPDPVGWSTAAVLLLAGTLLGGIPWWSSEVRLTQVRMEQKLRDWPNLAKRIHKPNLAMSGVVGTTFGFKGRFTWAAGLYAVKEILDSATAIEGALGAQAGSLRLSADGRSTNTVLWDLVERDPHSLPQDWVLPTRVGRAADPIELGPFENGDIATLERYVRGRGIRHMLIGGAPDSGKSGLINLIMATDVCTDDVFPIGLDFKGGAELGPWRDVCGFYTSKVGVAREMLRALADPDGVLDERGAILAESGLRSWDTEVHGPIIDIVVDEARELLGDGSPKAVGYFISIANRGRALGVRFVLATQYPTLEAIGSSQVRQSIPHRFCFRMEDETGEGYIVKIRIRADLIPVDRPGTCYYQDGEKVYTKPLRVSWVSDNTRDRLVKERRGLIAELDPRTEEAFVRLFPAFAERERWVDEDTAAAADREQEAGTTVNDSVNEEPVVIADDVPDLDVAAVLAARRAGMDPTERERLDRDRAAELASTVNEAENDERGVVPMLRALAAAGDSGLTPAQLQAAARRSSSWFFPKAKKLAEEGVMRRTTGMEWVMPEERRREYSKVPSN